MWEWEAKEAKGVFVIVHGANEYHVRYKWLIEKLNNSGFHVVMGDLPGHGVNPISQGHIHSFSEYIDTVEKWYERAVQFHLPIFILGHSMGGLVLIQTMIKKKFNVCAVILSSPCLGLTNPPSRLKHCSAYLIHKIYPKFRLPTNLAEGTRCKEMIQRDDNDPHLVKKVSVRWYFELTNAMESSLHEVSNFPNVPVLVLQGGNDLIVDKSVVIQWFNQLKNTEKYYKEWPGLYHEVFNEPEKEKVFRVTKTFTEMHLK
ncbi:phospholipase [Anaerobacillus alkalidiazotrophicus]|uniref:Phospholipase n=1 Tax=Anaerobacillus alkalidiazotrophicus TaxID=472963 RepID=A0A1S2M4V2_9BACI|nr:alpha/beta hydrolase [Anaerobacillus alkalidiazotrophicus]OIJ18175.1 phospholipase [Anaerobacillus alkalidiazotrophicus]OIJ19654.1 phospholipase [Anaerobacillus alkalidiazotrophicus]